MPGHAVTIKEIAQRAGVSVTVVSRVLNNKDGVISISPECRERVLQIIRETGYRPSAAARALAKGRTDVIGIMVQTTGERALAPHGFYAPAFAAAMVQAQRARYSAVAMFFANPAELADMPVMRESALEGVLVLDCVDAEVRGVLAERRIPAVFVNSQAEEPHDCIVADDEQGAKDAMAYLTGLGHRDIALLLPQGQHPSCRKRLTGCGAALADLGLAMRDDRIFGSAEATVAAFANGNPQGLTAVFCYSDDHLAALVTGLYRRGLRIPEDVSVVSCNDTLVASQVVPPVTSVAVPITEMARAGIVMLLERIRTGSPVPSRTFAETLVVRESCRRRRA